METLAKNYENKIILKHTVGGGKVRRPMQYVGQKKSVHFLETDSLRTPHGHLNFKKKILFSRDKSNFLFFCNFFFHFFFSKISHIFFPKMVFFSLFF